jgi:hypothetical protein
MRYLLILISFISFAQPSDATFIDLSNMTGNVVLGDDIGFEPNCDTPIQSFVTNDIDFNGYQIILNNAILYVEGDIQFGGSFKGYCNATVCVLGGTVFNSDPPDPGGDIFTTSPPNIPNPFIADECVDIVDTVGWYEFYPLFTNPRLNLPYYDSVTGRFDTDEPIEVYNTAGMLVLRHNDMLCLERGIYIVKIGNRIGKIIR